MTTLVHPSKSTTVRSLSASLVHAASRVAPGAAAWAALQLFFWTPRRRLATPAQLAALARARTVEIKAAGRSIRTYAWGDGPTILLVHGWGGLAAQLDRFVRPLVDAGYRVIAFDLPGHGRSSGTSTDVGEVSRVIGSLAAWFGPLHGVVAHSLGVAATALALADGVRVPRLAFLGAAVEPGRYWQAFVDRLGLAPGARAVAEERAASRVGRTLSEVSVLRSMRDVDASLLVVHDEQDRWADVEGARTLAASRPDAKLMITRGLGHSRILEDRTVLARVLEHLADTPIDTRPTEACSTPGCTRDAAPESAWQDPRCFECLLQRELEMPALRWRTRATTTTTPA